MTGAHTERAFEDAIERHLLQCPDRDPAAALLAYRRAVVHFAVDSRLVFITTRLAGDKTRFLPFNLGTAAPGQAGGAGSQPPEPGRHPTAYLWELIWQPDTWLDCCGGSCMWRTQEWPPARAAATSRASVHLLPVIFPRFHQWHAVVSLAEHAARHGSGHTYLTMLGENARCQAERRTPPSNAKIRLPDYQAKLPVSRL